MSTLEAKVVMPRVLTTKNRTKGLLTRKFYETAKIDCPVCNEIGVIDEDCDFCKGDGFTELPVPIQWTTIEEIYTLIVEQMGEE